MDKVRWKVWMDKVRWETLVLAAAILVGALAIASSMRANRYYYIEGPRLLDTQTGTVYRRNSSDGEWAEYLRIK